MSANQVRTAAVVVLTLAMLGGVQTWHSQLGATHAPGQDKSSSPQDKKDAVDEKTILALIKQLGDDSFDIRNAADKRLAAIGEPALDHLQKAALESKDAEVRQRAAVLVEAIGKKLFVQVRQSPGHKSPAGASRVVVTPDGLQALSVGQDALRSWDLVTGKETVVWQRKGGDCWGLAVSADGKRVIMGCSGMQCHVWDLVTGKRVSRPLLHSASVGGAVLSADGKLAVSGSADKSIRVWDVDNANEIRAFEGVTEDIRCLALSPDGKQVAAGHSSGANRPGIVRLWDIATGKEIRAFNGHKLEITGVAFSADGKMLLATGLDKTIRLWNVDTGRQLKTLEGHTDHVSYAAFTPDSKRVVSCGNQRNPTLRLWDVATGKQLLESEPVKGGFFCVAVLPDNRQCVSAGQDGVVRLWRWAR